MSSTYARRECRRSRSRPKKLRSFGISDPIPEAHIHPRWIRAARKTEALRAQETP